jgi:hypothetical protein
MIALSAVRRGNWGLIPGMWQMSLSSTQIESVDRLALHPSAAAGVVLTADNKGIVTG